MAGDWIKMRNNLWDDPRVSRLCDLVGAIEATVIGGLYWLWSAADEHTECGHLVGLSVGGIDRKTGVPGLGAALVAVGWIADTEDGVTICRFTEHNGTSAKRRSHDGQRKANSRLSASHADNVGTNYGQNAPNPGAREEKNKEELTTSIPDGIDADSTAAGKPAVFREKPDCPHQEIIALYHEVLPQCPQVRDWTPARATQLRARWNEDAGRQDLAYWRRFFEYVAKCDFLVGRAGNKPFFADLEWLTKSANFTKIREAKYENRGTHGHH